MVVTIFVLTRQIGLLRPSLTVIPDHTSPFFDPFFEPCQNPIVSGKIVNSVPLKVMR